MSTVVTGAHTRKVTLSAAVAAKSAASTWTEADARAKPAPCVRDIERTLLERKASRGLPDQTSFDLRKARARALRGAITSAELDRATAAHSAAEAFMADVTALLLALDRKAHTLPLREDSHGGQWTVSDVIAYWFSGESKPDAAKRAGY